MVKRYNSFVKKNPDVYVGTKSIARIALLWPSRSANLYRGSSVPLTDFTKEMKSEGIGDISAEFNGFYEALSRRHFPFDVIDEEQLGIESSELKAKYNLIILPNAACLSKEDIGGIERFVEVGGNILATFETSLYDEYGERLPDFQLNRVLGVHFGEQVFGPMSWDYIAAKNSNSPVLDGITRKYLPAPTYGIKLETSGAEEILSFCERLAGCYDGIPALSSDPCLLTNTYGKGRAFYLAGTYGETLYKFRFQEYYQLVRNVGNLLSQRLIDLEDAPSSIEVALRKKDNKLFIHLVNFTSEMKRPIERIMPVHNVKAHLKIGTDFKKIKALWLDKELSAEKDADGITFVIPRINEYEVIVMEER